MVLVHWGGFEYSSSGIIPGLFSYSFFFKDRLYFMAWEVSLFFLMAHYWCTVLTGNADTYLGYEEAQGSVRTPV